MAGDDIGAGLGSLVRVSLNERRFISAISAFVCHEIVSCCRLGNGRRRTRCSDYGVAYATFKGAPSKELRATQDRISWRRGAN